MVIAPDRVRNLYRWRTHLSLLADRKGVCGWVQYDNFDRRLSKHVLDANPDNYIRFCRRNFIETICSNTRVWIWTINSKGESNKLFRNKVHHVFSFIK